MATSNRLHLSLFFLSFSLLSAATTVSGVSPSRDSQNLEAELLCKQTYGFMPCSKTALGNLFLIIVYGYLIFVASKCFFEGSEMLKVLGPGCFGKIVLPKLDALPSAILILASGLSEKKEISQRQKSEGLQLLASSSIMVSGLSGTKESAQSQVLVGMGLLAGSTVMLLTVIWGSCIIAGKCDVGHSVTKDGQNTKGFSLTETGVSTEIWTCYTARIMAISVIPFIIVQMPQILHSTSGRNFAVLIALIVSALMFIAYCLYQVSQPWIQKWHLDYARRRHLISGIMNHLSKRALGRLLNDRGEPNRLFDLIDENKDGQLSVCELRSLIIGIRFDEMNLDLDAAADNILKDLDTNLDGQINFDKFIEGIEKWLNEVIGGKRCGDPGFQTAKLIFDFYEKTERELELLGEEEETFQYVDNRQMTKLKAVSMLFIGTIIAAAFSNPLVDAVTNFSIATSIPSFFVSFIALPMATKLSVVVPLLLYASHKRKRTASSTFIELYTTVSTDNVIYLSVFLAIVYIKGLSWDFSAEVLAIAVVCMLVGGFASVCTTFPLWTCLLAYMLYPFSLALVYVLDYVLGWT